MTVSIPYTNDAIMLPKNFLVLCQFLLQSDVWFYLISPIEASSQLHYKLEKREVFIR